MFSSSLRGLSKPRRPYVCQSCLLQSTVPDASPVRRYSILTANPSLAKSTDHEVIPYTDGELAQFKELATRSTAATSNDGDARRPKKTFPLHLKEAITLTEALRRIQTYDVEKPYQPESSESLLQGSSSGSTKRQRAKLRKTSAEITKVARVARPYSLKTKIRKVRQKPDATVVEKANTDKIWNRSNNNPSTSAQIDSSDDARPDARTGIEDGNTGSTESILESRKDKKHPLKKMKKIATRSPTDQNGKLRIRRFMSARHPFRIRQVYAPIVHRKVNSDTKVLTARLLRNRARNLRTNLARHKANLARNKAKLAGDKTIKVARKEIAFKDGLAIVSNEAMISALDVERPPVPKLSYGLERVLFNPGVYHLQDPRSKVFNFDPYLQSIMPVSDFDFNALKEYITSSKDQSLRKLALEHGRKYIGSSSSMTSVLAHFHFLLSQWRELNTAMLSRGFPERLQSFTSYQRSPTSIFLRWNDGVYAIDADKELDSANVLMSLGKSMEKLLTLSTDQFERYRRSSEHKVPEHERIAPEAYHYCTAGDFLMRSQLDAYDERLPGTGMFDLKTRAVVSIRMDAKNYEQMLGYQIKTRLGHWESFEREYFDMMRSAFLKYSLQVRMGRMDGIFVAYHNIERIFGFQYISLPEMDDALHGQTDTILGDEEFKFSIALFNKILNRATEKFPETSVRLHFETRDSRSPFMYIFAEPVTEEQVDTIQAGQNHAIEDFERSVLGLEPRKIEAADGSIQVPSMPPTDRSSSITTFLDASTIDQGSEEDRSPASVHGVDAAAAAADITLSSDLTSTEGGQETDKRLPLLALTLHVRNKVNGFVVDRPTRLREDDTWSVEYQIEEVPERRSHDLYEACKRRRRAAVPDAEEEIDVARNFYVSRLRALSMAGRDWRQREDEAANSEEKVLLSGC